MGSMASLLELTSQGDVGTISDESKLSQVKLMSPQQLYEFVGDAELGLEERVTTQFSGLVVAYEDQSEEAFMTTQQADEARHAQHVNRFYEQVVGLDMTFDERLREVRGTSPTPSSPCSTSTWSRPTSGSSRTRAT
jgi:ribonucleoside-diphosphate reductase beta chain